MTQSSPPAAGRPIRVLHLCEPFNPGGVVWWLIDVVKTISPDQARFDFLCCGTTRGVRAPEVADLGCRIELFQPTLREVLFGKTVRRVIREGEYDVVHAHPFNLSGWLLRHARALGVPVRIAHYHTTGDGCANSLARHLRRTASRLVARRNANVVLACSAAALQRAPVPFTARLRRVLHYGLAGPAVSPADSPPDLRAQLNLPPETKLVGHVGRFVPAKNYLGLLEIFARLRQRAPDCDLILVGSGPLEETVRRQARELGIAEHVHFLGQRLDVPALMRAFDLFLLPSVREGLGLVLVEARMAGTPVVAAKLPGPSEALDGAGACSLVDPREVERFADEAARLLAAGRDRPPEAWAREWTIARSASALLAIYRECLASR